MAFLFSLLLELALLGDKLLHLLFDLAADVRARFLSRLRGVGRRIRLRRVDLDLQLQLRSLAELCLLLVLNLLI